MFITHNVKAQMPITVTSGQICYSAGSNTANASVITFSPSWTFSWTAIGSSSTCAISYSNVTSNGSSVDFNFGCCGVYTLNCSAYSGSSLVTTVSQTYAVACPQNIVATSSPGSTLCAGTTATLSASGAVTYTWNVGATGANILVTPSVSTCYSVVGTNANGCQSNTGVICLFLNNWPTLSINGPTTCMGSSAVYSVSGALTCTWLTTPPTVGYTTSIIPGVFPIGSALSVIGTGSNGCTGTYSTMVYADTTCVNVWPGDANSDGIVNNLDVLQLGLSFAATGAARSPGGNSFTSQYATAWIGNGSTGKNKAHIDCNGDGTVNNNDTVAIHTNYSSAHSFKPSNGSSTNSDISLIVPNTVTEGTWNKADIMLGTSVSPISQLYGTAFEINYDNAMIENNSVYIIYSASFLNAANQNVQFRKTYFNNGKLYAASVRTDASNVSGNGKIGEFWFKPKTGLAANSVINLSTSNSSKIGNSGVNSSLTDGSAVSTTIANSVGLKETFLQNNVRYFPNPASNKLTIQSDVNATINYVVFDIVGRELTKGEFTNVTNVDLSSYANGTYIIRLESGSATTYKKVVIEK